MNCIFEAFDRFFPARFEFLKALVEQNSFTTNREGVHKVQRMLEGELQLLGFATERITSPKRADILVAKNESAKTQGTSILLVGHADTVHPVQSAFKHWSVDGDVMRGPGVLDMKGGLVHILLALDIIKELGKFDELPLQVICNSAEENSTPMSSTIMRELAVGAREALVFEIGRANGGIVTQRKGIVEIQIESVGKAAHSGNNFHEGLNAILPLCQVALEIAAITNEEEDLTVNIAHLRGGDQFNIVPQKAILFVELRGRSSELINKAVEQIKQIVGSNPMLLLTLGTQMPPLNKIPDKTDEFFLKFSQAATLVGFKVAELPRVGGGSDANHIGSVGVPTLDALGPYGTGAHTDQELVYISSIKERVCAVAQYLMSSER